MLTTARIEFMPLDELRPADRNPKRHNLDGVRTSIARFGFVAPAILDERTGRLVVGHGRTSALAAMRDAGQQPPDGVQLDPAGRWLIPVRRGWASRSDAEAAAYLVADNQHTIAGGWDDDALTALVRDINQHDADLTDALGFDTDDLDRMLAALHDDTGGHRPGGADPHDDYDGDDPEHGPGGTAPAGLADGALLPLAGTTVGEPDITTRRGQVWRLGDQHVLAVVSPHKQWQVYTPYLEGEALLWPYPSPHAALVPVPAHVRIVMVQPQPYTAGWILTKWARVTGGTPTLLHEGTP